MAGALAYEFVTPPDPALAITQFDFDRDPARMEAFSAVYDTYRDATLSAFRKRGGKLLIFHGTADPIFSALESIDYYQRLARNNGGPDATARWARLFLVPGMNHCAGGPATDSFDGLAAIVDWVEKGAAPSRIEASARPARCTSRDGRARSARIRSYARYTGNGSLEDGANFTCVHRPAATRRARQRPCAGIYNWIHGTGDAERSFAFYRDVFGIELARSPFAGAALRQRAAGDDPAGVAGRFRSAGLGSDEHARLALPHGLHACRQHAVRAGAVGVLRHSARRTAGQSVGPGASKLIFTVRDLDAVAGAIEGAGRAGRDARRCRGRQRRTAARCSSAIPTATWWKRDRPRRPRRRRHSRRAT